MAALSRLITGCIPFATFLAALSAPAHAQDSQWDGRWFGGYTLQGRFVPVNVAFTTRDGNITATLGAPFDGIRPTPLTSITITPAFRAEVVVGTSTLRLQETSRSADGLAIAGTIARGSDTGSFHLSRVAAISASALEQWIGDYEVEPGHFIDVNANKDFGWLTYIDRATGRFGAILPLSDSTFFGGPARLVTYPHSVLAKFTHDKRGNPELLLRDGGSDVRAHRVDILESVPVAIESQGARLGATLTKPKGQGPFPGLVLVHGSDPNTRFDAPAQHYFARLGFAVLTWDKRGNGASTGDFANATFDTLATDVIAALRFLRAQPSVDSKHVGMWGISQAGWIAPLAARRDGNVAFLALTSGATTTPRRQGHNELESTRRVRGDSAAEILHAKQYLDLYYDALRDPARLPELETLYQLERTRGATWLWAPAAVRSAGAQFFARNMDVDPVPAIASLRIPMLYVFGERDGLVPFAEHIVALERALQISRNDQVTIRIMPKANHRMEETDTGDNAEFALTSKAAPGYYALLGRWLQRVSH